MTGPPVTPTAGGNKYGTLGSSVATFSASGLTVTGITVQNTFDKSAHPEITDTQAVAITAQGDRQTFTNDRFVSRQDTVLNWSPSSTGQYRQYFYSSFISGDVDFVFGNATAVYDRVNIQLRNSAPLRAVSTASSPRPTPVPRRPTASSSPAVR